MSDIVEKIKDLREAQERLRVYFEDFQRREGDRQAVAILKRAKRAGLIETYQGDPEGKQG